MRNALQMKVLKRSLLALLGVLMILVGERAAAVLNSKPQISGTLFVDGLTNTVEIIRDEYGVPHIYGADDRDVFFGLGVAHAQDRLWQMEMSRRIAKGRLSEIMGSSTGPFDTFFRSLGLGEAVERSFRNLLPETQMLLRAYAAGVNAVIDDDQTSLPPEFVLLYHSPERWTVYDSLLIPKLMSLSLSTNMFHEVRRAQLLREIGPKNLDTFLPDAPVKTSDLPTELLELYQNLEVADFAAPLIDRWQQGVSNNWAVDGRHTESGAPLLANDPHLELSSPSIWYLAHMSLQSGDVIGATIAGLPSVVLGRNNQIAWGFTNTGADVQDLYIEKINPANPQEYLTPTGYQTFESRNEMIRVRFAPDIPITVRKTRHGPVLPENWLQSNEFLGSEHVLSLAWTALSDDDVTADASVALMQAKNWAGFVRATQSMVHPMQNIVYGDVRGHIGSIAPARVPIRGDTNKLYGMFPAPGWDARYDWKGFIPFKDLPKSFNPASGKIYTANNKIVADDYPYWITHLWETEHRLNRISELLRKTQKHNRDSFVDMQRDTFSPDTRDLLPHLLNVQPRTELARRAVKIVRAWDGHMRKESAAALIYTAWLRELAKQLYADELGNQFYRHWDLKADFLSDAMTGKDSVADWCDNVITEPIEDCGNMAQAALDQSLAELSAQFGDNPGSWSWGEAHMAAHAHTPFEQFPILGSIFGRRIASDGGFYSLNRGGHRLAGQDPFANIHGSGFRAIFDFSDLEKSIFIQSTGQSGNPVSPFFDTFVETWADVNYIPMRTDKAQILTGASSKLRLAPD